MTKRKVMVVGYAYPNGSETLQQVQDDLEADGLTVIQQDAIKGRVEYEHILLEVG